MREDYLQIKKGENIMITQEQEVRAGFPRTEYKQHGNNIMSVASGLLLGGVAGAVTMLLVAPQSGQETRAQIKHKSIELRERTTESVNDAVAVVSDNTHRITAGIHEKAEELQHRGQEILVKQLDHVSAALEASKTAVDHTAARLGG
jgi:gas vesicle protein